MNINQLDQNQDVEESQSKDDTAGELQKLLIVKSGENERLAVPLNNIIRIERVPVDNVRSVGSQMTYEFMGKSIALFRVDEVADISKATIEGQCFVVIFEALNRHLGLLVKEVIDSVEVVVEFDETTHKQPGIFGSAYINDHLTLLVDLFGIVEVKKPQWVHKAGINVSKKEEKHTILVVDDSKFFVKQISGFLEESGYQTLKAMDGVEALEVLRGGDQISLVLTDIEMPVMDGWQLVQEIRRDQALKELPVIAVTSVAGDYAREKGMNLGINEYLIKLDKEEILQNLKRHLYDRASV
ncbi:MAG: response regulator [Lentisphaerales bacterium]|nr:response regulator [Lentisphaerales bacterium]